MNRGEIISKLKPYCGLEEETNLSIKFINGETIKITKVEFMNEKLVMFGIKDKSSQVFEFDEIENAEEEEEEFSK